MSTQYLNGSTTFIPINFSIVIQVLILIVVIACSTRFISGWNYSSEVSIDESTRRPAMIPYWVPYLGHLIPLTVNPSHFLQKCRCVRIYLFPLLI